MRTDLKYFFDSPYATILDMQHALLNQVAELSIPNQLLLGTHPHTITLGRRSNPAHLHIQRAISMQLAVPDVFAIERGGDVTYHGPGQLVGYPIFNLKQMGTIDLHLYLRNLENVLITTLANFGIQGQSKKDWTGVWVGDKKIASIGIAVKRWVTYHGFALNLATDLRYFQLLDPCGLPATVMTSMLQETGRSVDWHELIPALTQAFTNIMHVQFDLS